MTNNTDKKNLEIEEVREHLENIIALMPGHVYWKNIHGIIQGCNDLQAKDAGLSSRKEIIGKTDYEMPWKEQADLLRKIDLEVMATGIAITVEEPSTLSNGKVAIFLSKKVPHYHKGKIVGIVGISFDITAQKRMEQELNETRHKLQHILDTIPGHVYWKDSNGIYLGSNCLQAQVGGFFSSEDMIRKSDHDMPWSKDADSFRTADLEVMSSGIAKIVEESGVSANGEPLIFLSKKAPLYYKNKIVGVLGVSIDITQQKRAQQELNETRQKLEKILDTIPGHVYWKDINGFYLGCNYQLAKDAGLNASQDVIGKSDYDMPWQKQAHLIRKIDMEIIQTGISQTVEVPSTIADGTNAIFLSKKAPLYNEGQIIGILGISFDITEHKKAKERLLETEKKLEGMSLVGASIAHELRTPLATLGIAVNNFKKYFPHFIEAYKLAKAAGLPIHKIKDNHFRLLEELSDSMESEINAAFTFIDMLLMNLKPTISGKSQDIFLMSACIKETLVRYPFQAEQKELVNINTENDFEVSGNMLLIIHVFFNLIKNSLYHIAAAGKGTITIGLQSDDNHNIVLFKDTGAGIPSGVLPNIFNRFYSNTHNGAGIGLTFCQMVMESLGGHIHCESVEKVYTLFSLSFPKILDS